MVIEPRTVIPVSARVVDAGLRRGSAGKNPGQGPLHGATSWEWCIPILWPIDLLNLLRRGPRPILKTETRLTVKVMDDMEVPITEDPDRDPSGLYRREPSSLRRCSAVRSQQATSGAGADLPAAPAVSTAAVSTTAVSTKQYQPPQQAYVPPAPVPIYIDAVCLAPAPMVYV